MNIAFIFGISRIKDITRSNLVYSRSYGTKENFLENEKMYLHRFIFDIGPSTNIYYRIDIQNYTTPNRNIFVDIPLRSITRYGVLLEYEYYKDIYKTNNGLGLINEKYFISYYEIGLFNPSKINTKRQNIKLGITFYAEKI